MSQAGWLFVAHGLAVHKIYWPLKGKMSVFLICRENQVNSFCRIVLLHFFACFFFSVTLPCLSFFPTLPCHFSNGSPSQGHPQHEIHLDGEIRLSERLVSWENIQLYSVIKASTQRLPLSSGRPASCSPEGDFGLFHSAITQSGRWKLDVLNQTVVKGIQCGNVTLFLWLLLMLSTVL